MLPGLSLLLRYLLVGTHSGSTSLFPMRLPQSSVRMSQGGRDLLKMENGKEERDPGLRWTPTCCAAHLTEPLFWKARWMPDASWRMRALTPVPDLGGPGALPGLLPRAAAALRPRDAARGIRAPWGPSVKWAARGGGHICGAGVGYVAGKTRAPCAPSPLRESGSSREAKEGATGTWPSGGAGGGRDK